jgi:hypothetical protein
MDRLPSRDSDDEKRQQRVFVKGDRVTAASSIFMGMIRDRIPTATRKGALEKSRRLSQK